MVARFFDMASGVLTDENSYIWLALGGATLGKPGSTADLQATNFLKLYQYLWPFTVLPVSGGRGSSSLADWNANKRLTLPDARGRTIIGFGQGSGLTNRDLGQLVGAETHTLTLAQMPVHSHQPSVGSFFVSPGSGGAFTVSTQSGAMHNTTLNTNSQGQGQAHNNMQPSIVMSWFISTGEKG
ncbi:hypothetical protein HJG54_19635 [Leptolyngbya sp. NK1-12]|uniref:Phage tail collar domain-containing protein n=1 Tax=Leptolyngbya sp. NK1-12 TaxID=2547451 RepID=A0AA97AGY6_9CYAN|nr:hypothetical protein [Leptolyngbya sp. NK1-12]WNZ24840.1 hypothetical protein HJG54_19635 [Leptolyngbya sp. NK1-12]